MIFRVEQKQKTAHYASFLILSGETEIGKISVSHIRTRLVEGTVEFNGTVYHFKTSVQQKERGGTTNRILVFAEEPESGEAQKKKQIADLRQLSRPNAEFPAIQEPYIHLGFEKDSYSAYMVSFAHQGTHIAIKQEDGTQISEVKRSCHVVDELFQYTIYGIDQAACEKALLLAMYRFVFFDFEYGTNPWKGTRKIVDPKTINRSIISQYNPEFERIWARDA